MIKTTRLRTYFISLRVSLTLLRGIDFFVGGNFVLSNMNQIYTDAGILFTYLNLTWVYLFIRGIILI